MRQRVRTAGIRSYLPVVAALLVGLGLIAGLTWWVETRETERVVSELGARAVQRAAVELPAQLLADDLTAPHTPAKLTALAGRLTAGRPVGGRPPGAEPLRIRLYARDGTIVFADLPGSRGRTVGPASSLALQAALGGRVTSEIVALSSPDDADLRARHPQALKVVAPVVLDGAVLGAVETYEDLTPVLNQRTWIWTTTLVSYLVVAVLLIVVARVLGGRFRRQAELAREAYHDPLTGLPNRRLWDDRLEQALARAVRHGRSVAVLFIDLDNFKTINDRLGHAVGDRLLVTVAERIGQELRREDSAARLGGDEFVLLLTDISEPAAAAVVAERVLQQIAAPIDLQGEAVHVSASIGIAIGPANADQPAALLHCADLAMYRAKAKGKARPEFFEAADAEPRDERALLATELTQALHRRQFEVYYQPIVHLTTGQLLAVEALIRWRHPRRGLLLPGEFLPVAEESDLVVLLGRFVLTAACRQVRTWQHQYVDAPPLVLSVNLSPRQFQDPRLIDDIARILRQTGLPAERLKLELPESVLIQEPRNALPIMDELKTLGVQLAVAGTANGFPSLTALRDCPIDVIKLDRTLLSRLNNGSRDRTIVRAIVYVARQLHQLVVGEGIETAEQALQLRALGCQYGQGYYFAHPLTSAELGARLETAFYPR